MSSGYLSKSVYLSSLLRFLLRCAVPPPCHGTFFCCVSTSPYNISLLKRTPPPPPPNLQEFSAQSPRLCNGWCSYHISALIGSRLHEPIWEGSLEESSSATLLGFGMSSALPGVHCNCHWMKRALRKWRTVGVCWGMRMLYPQQCFPLFLLNKSMQTRWDWATCLVYIFFGLFWGVLQPGENRVCSMQPCCALIKMTHCLASDRRIVFSAFIPIFLCVANVISRPWNIARRWRCVLLPDLPCRSSEKGSMGAIFPLASHEEARDVNVSPCLLNTQ